MQTVNNTNAAAGAGGQLFEPYIDKAEVGRRTQMRPRTIDDWMKRGLLPYYKVGRSVRFKWSEVEQHLGARYRVNGTQVNR